MCRRLGDELPYATGGAKSLSLKNVERSSISVPIFWVEKDSHKAIVIGKGGESLKQIGTSARRNCEELLEGKVFYGVVR